MARTKGVHSLRDKAYYRNKLELCRERIEVNRLIKRLEDNGFAEKEFLTQGQIRCIEIVLAKSLPNLVSAEIQHQGMAPFALIPEQMQDVSKWEEAFTPATKTEH